jgi:rhamnosyltransferase
MKKIHSILVAYNPEGNELSLAIERLKKQTDIVIVCNNSDYDIKFEDDNVKVFNFNDNLGIAKAQSIGMKWAFENGADFILQMDQDSILEDKTVERLVQSYDDLTSKGYNIGVVGPQIYDKITNEVDKARIIKGEIIEDTSYTILKQTLSSASLIPKIAYDTVGGMEDGLFIDAVDFEYCWRLKTKGFLTIRDNDILLGHRVGDGKKQIVGKIDARIPSPIRHYYHIRNLFLLLFRGYVPLYWKLSNLVKLSIKLVIYPFIFEDGKIRFMYMVRGIKDGMLRKYGRIDKTYRIQKNG